MKFLSKYDNRDFKSASLLLERNSGKMSLSIIVTADRRFEWTIGENYKNLQISVAPLKANRDFLVTSAQRRGERWHTSLVILV